MAKPKQIPTYEGLSKKQINTLPLFVDPSIETITEIAEKGNVCRSTIYGWLDDDNFRRALDKKIDTYTDSEMANIWKSLVRKAQAGDTQAIKLYFEMKNKYKQQIDISVTELPNINLVRGDDG